MARKIFKKPPVPLFWPVIVAGLLMAAFRGASAMPRPEGASSIFTDVTEAGGITWKHFNGESPDAHLIEAKNGGAAFFDFDQDGLWDIFLVNGGETPRGKSPSPVRNALYRNLGNGKFEEIAARAGVDHISFYGIAVAVGDYDNDGYPDLLVTGYPERALFHNNRDGTFSEVAGKAGLKGSGRWSTGAAWFDFTTARRMARCGHLSLRRCHSFPLRVANSGGTPPTVLRVYGERRAIGALSQQWQRDFADASTTSEWEHRTRIGER
jgi:hypothetical protein